MMEKTKIGLNAGRVWRILNEKGELSMFDLCRELSLTFEDVALAIGWLVLVPHIVGKDSLRLGKVFPYFVGKFSFNIREYFPTIYGTIENNEHLQAKSHYFI